MNYIVNNILLTQKVACIGFSMGRCCYGHVEARPPTNKSSPLTLGERTTKCDMHVKNKDNI